MAANTPLTQDEKDHAREMHSKGYAVSYIARYFDVTRSMIYRIVKECEWKNAKFAAGNQIKDARRRKLANQEPRMSNG